MSKLCQCIVKRLKSNTHLVYWAGIASKKANYSISDASEMENMVDEILESDCVCFSYCESDHDHSKYKCIPRPGWKEKQSQSPCEHPKDSREFLLFNCQIPRTLEHTSRLLYLCHKCGLVTCLDPNRSGPSKNPNDK